MKIEPWFFLEKSKRNGAVCAVMKAFGEVSEGLDKQTAGYVDGGVCRFENFTGGTDEQAEFFTDNFTDAVGALAPFGEVQP